MKRRDVGIMGEKIAADFLREMGWEILETNYRCRDGEIDIVARDGDYLAFVEVRTRRSHDCGSPEESITPGKMIKLRTAAARYIQERENPPELWRIDVVAVELDRRGNASRVELYENAVGGE